VAEAGAENISEGVVATWEALEIPEGAAGVRVEIPEGVAGVRVEMPEGAASVEIPGVAACSWRGAERVRGSAGSPQGNPRWWWYQPGCCCRGNRSSRCT